MTSIPNPLKTRADVLALLDRRLGDTDLHTIIFNLGLQYANFGGPHTPKNMRIVTLYEYYEQRDDLTMLFAAITHARPDIKLPDPATLTASPAAPSAAPAPSPSLPPSSASGSTISPGSASQYGTVFISYSSKDEAFAQKLYDDLIAAGVRVWFAPENLPIGAKIRDTIHQKIAEYDKLLLILSQDSVASDWVADEVEKAMDRERREKCSILFPIRLDDSVMNTNEAWAESIRITRQIGNFTGWQDPAAYQRTLNRLLRDLKA